ncbi:MAG: hypothetical protein M3347_02035 [Armatimonadota bacterium]|nr:hypothetical protein [Armatimonadota bacterium]
MGLLLLGITSVVMLTFFNPKRDSGLQPIPEGCEVLVSREIYGGLIGPSFYGKMRCSSEPLVVLEESSQILQEEGSHPLGAARKVNSEDVRWRDDAVKLLKWPRVSAPPTSQGWTISLLKARTKTVLYAWKDGQETLLEVILSVTG